ncbi:MAG: hypothetical protein IPN19_05930 [Elusimicrobia bacterium]|nr:hypothetical protein [Elusimicrobiota bacterium]
MKIQSNADLKLFLDILSGQFANAGDKESVNLLDQASQSYIGSSSEFLGEARISLSKILSTRKDKLTETEKNDLREAIQSIGIAFRKANGLNGV